MKYFRACRVLLGFGLIFALTACNHASVLDQSQQTQVLAERTLAATRVEYRLWALRWQARGRVLGALSPDHRQVLGRIIGQLSIASKPDVQQAVDELDTTLTDEEKQTILTVYGWQRGQLKPYEQQWRAQMTAENPPIHFGKEPKRIDPGAMLLVLATNSIALESSLGVRGLSTIRPEVKVRWH